jgi:hypothetical protein
MSPSLRERKLSNGDFFVFNHHTKDLYLISKANKKYWEKSKKTENSLRDMVKANQALFFAKSILAKVAAALNSIALAKIAGINL